MNGRYLIAASVTETQAFQDGHADRQAWETWLDGGHWRRAFHDGAEFWASHRSDPTPPACSTLPSDDILFREGCEEAKERLQNSDRRRKAEPDYKAGWNSPVAVATAAAPAEPAAPTKPENQTAAAPAELAPSTTDASPGSQAAPSEDDVKNIPKEALEILKQEFADVSRNNPNGDGVFTGDIHHPKYAWDYYIRGTIHFLDGQNDAAISDLTYAVDHELRTYGLFNTLGYVYLDNHQYQLAENAFDQAILINPAATKTIWWRDKIKHALALGGLQNGAPPPTTSNSPIAAAMQTAVFTCRDLANPESHPYIVTVNAGEKTVLVEDSSGMCTLRYKDGAYGSIYDKGQACGLFAGGDVRQEVKIDENHVSTKIFYRNGVVPWMTLDLSTGLMRSSDGTSSPSVAQCHRSRS